MGLGSDHDEVLCKQLAAHTGGAYTKLNSIDDLKLLEEHFKQITAPRTLIKILDGINQLFISVYDDPVRFQIENIDSFYINDKNYTFEENKNIEILLEEPPVKELSYLEKFSQCLYSFFFTPPTREELMAITNTQMKCQRTF